MEIGKVIAHIGMMNTALARAILYRFQPVLLLAFAHVVGHLVSLMSFYFQLELSQPDQGTLWVATTDSSIRNWV